MRTEQRVAPAAGFLDGDALRRFIDGTLGPAQREMVLRGKAARDLSAQMRSELGLRQAGEDGMDTDGDESPLAIVGVDAATVTRWIENLGRVC